MSIAWSSRCAFSVAFNKACSSSVTYITRCWENTMYLPVFQVPSHSAFSFSKTWLSSFSSGSRQQPQLAMGIQVLGLSGCCCRRKAAILQLDTLLSICSLADRSALSQCLAVTTCCATSWMHSLASAIYNRVSWPSVGITAWLTQQRPGHKPCKSSTNHTGMPD